MPRHVLLASLFAFLLTACDNTAAPEENGPEDPYAEAIIDEAGGEVSNGDFTLTIPPGAFSSASTIELDESTEDFLGDHSASPVYHVTGVPGDFSAPLTLHIKYTEPLVDVSFIAVRYEATVEDFDSSYTAYVIRLLAVTEAGGFVSGELRPLETTDLAGTGVLRDGGDLLDFWGGVSTDGDTWDFEGSHFILASSHKELLAEQGSELLAHLEDAYDLWGNTYGLAPEGSAPILLDVMPTASSAPDHISILSSNVLIGDNPDYVAGQVYVHWGVVEGIRRETGLTYHFFGQLIGGAVVLYNFPRVPDHTLPKIRDGMDAFFDGVSALTVSNSTGLLPAATLEYLYEGNGRGLLGAVMTESRPSESLEQAVVRMVGMPEEWLSDLHRHMMEGTVWQGRAEQLGLDPDYWWTQSTGTLTVDSSTTTTQTTAAYEHLSGRIYQIDLDPNLQENSTLTLTAGADEFENPDLLVYTFDGSGLEYLGGATSTIVIENAEEYAAEGQDLMVVVSNPYMDESPIEITLEASLTEDEDDTPEVPDTPDHVRFKIRANYTAHHRDENGAEWDTDSFRVYDHSWDGIEGEWNEGKTLFTASYEEGNTVGAITIHRDLASDVITSFEWEAQTTSGDGSEVRASHVEASGIPEREGYSSDTSYRIDGAEACDALTRFYEKREFVSGPYEGAYSEFTGFSCDEESQLRVWFAGS